MAYLGQESFNIPPGFAVEEVKGQLYYEDLEEDDELWLIRMPCDVELSTLDRQKIFLSDNVGDVTIKKFESVDGKSLECVAETCEISNTSVILPKKENGQLHAVKKVFKGAILISEEVSLNNETKLKYEKEDDHLANNSCCQTGESIKEKIVKRKKKHQSDLNTNEFIEEYANKDENSEESNNKRKNKKKKKHSHSDFDLNN